MAQVVPRAPILVIRNQFNCKGTAAPHSDAQAREGPLCSPRGVARGVQGVAVIYLSVEFECGINLNMVLGVLCASSDVLLQKN